MADLAASAPTAPLPTARVTVSAVPVLHPIDLAGSVAVTRGHRRRRVRQIVQVGARHLGPVLARRVVVKDKDQRRAELGRALAVSVHELGVTFVKLGQLLASSPSIAGETLADAMRSVLDDGPAIPFAAVRATIETDLGRPLESVFATIEREPFAAASLAVVHRATLQDGTPVAVKVLRPQARQLVAIDLGIVNPIARRLARALPVAVLPMIPDVLDGLTEQLSEELDLRNEASVMDWFASMTELIGARKVRVPRTYPDASGPRVLTMEYVEGSSIDDLEAIADGSIDARAAVEALIETWFALALCTGVFHGDMHAGNLLLAPDGDVVLLDWGIIGQLPDASRRFFRRSLEGAMGDESAWPDVVAHFLTNMPPDLLRTAGLTEEMFADVIRAQTMAIMTMPFSELNLMMLVPSSPTIVPDEAPPAPESLRGWLTLVRDERRRIRGNEGLAALGQHSPPRGEMLLIKQLVFFERYGKLFLGDQPLIYDRAVYEALLALPGAESTGPSDPAIVLA